MAKQKDSSIYELVCDDHSGLGSRMGTERTTTMWTELFYKRADAVKYAIQFCRKTKRQDVMDEIKKLRKVNSVDAICYGFTITKRKIR